MSAIVLDSSANEVIRNTAQLLQQEIARRTNVKVPIFLGEKENPDQGQLHKIFLGTRDQSRSVNKTLESFDTKAISADTPGAEGFHIKAFNGPDGACIVINGCDDLGTVHGVGWFLRQVDFQETMASVAADLDLASAPVAKIRLIRFGDAQGYPNTPLEGWREIWSDFALWGLGAVVVRCDPAHQGDPRQTEAARVLWDRWAKMVPLARSLGLDIAHLTQTNLTFKDGEFGPSEVPNFQELNYMCPDFNGVNPKFPRGHKLLLDGRKWFFDRMPHIKDVRFHIMSSWDGGGCNDPHVYPWSVTCAELVDEIFPLLAAHNPDARVIYSITRYWIPGLDKLAEKLHAGWRPAWLHALEFDHRNYVLAPLFPKDIPRVYMPMWTTDYDSYAYQSSGANPCPDFIEQDFDRLWNICEVRDGTTCYSEGTNDYINQILMMQKAWNPERKTEDIAEELCRYYFGSAAAPIVKKLLYLLERERIVDLAWPLTNPRVQELAREAEKVMPQWARVSRQWQMIAGRVGLSRTRQRQADLLKDFQTRWGEYKTLLSTKSPDARQAITLRKYFEAVHENALEMQQVHDQLSRRAFAVIGGSQYMWGPKMESGDAAEALATLRAWKKHDRLQSVGRWSAAFVDMNGNIGVCDGFDNRVETKETSADARLVIANLGGKNGNEVVFWNSGHQLAAWSPMGGTRILAEGELLCGPLAAGDLDEDGLDEILTLAGQNETDAQLAAVNAKGRIRKLNIAPAGAAPDEYMRGVILGTPKPTRTFELSREPHVQVCDINGDKHLEIICSDLRNENRLTIYDRVGRSLDTGPASPAGALACGDLNGDGRPEIVYAGSDGYFAAMKRGGGTITLPERVCPKWLSAVTVADLDGRKKAEIVYAGEDGFPRRISLAKKSERLSELPTSDAFGPGMVTGDFDGDGLDEVMFLRRRLDWFHLLCVMSYVGNHGDLRDLPWYNNEPVAMTGIPLGPRASGRIRFR